eukprot:scaffold2612_cov267-Chaetoceros_neogracile.AAC.96
MSREETDPEEKCNNPGTASCSFPCSYVKTDHFQSYSSQGNAEDEGLQLDQIHPSVRMHMDEAIFAWRIYSLSSTSYDDGTETLVQ